MNKSDNEKSVAKADQERKPTPMWERPSFRAVPAAKSDATVGFGTDGTTIS